MLNTSKTTWDLSPLFSGDNDPNMEADKKRVEEISYAFINKWKNDNSYLSDLGKLKEALDEYENWNSIVGFSGNTGYYFSLRSAQEETNPVIKSKLSLVDIWSQQIAASIQFFELQLGNLPLELQEKILSDSRFSVYRHWLERLFAQARHHLSEDAEKVMVLKSTPAYSRWLNLTSEALSGEEYEIILEDGVSAIKPFSEIQSLLDSPVKTVRDQAAQIVNQIFRKHLHAVEAELNAVLENKRVDDLLRNMPRPDTSRHLHDDVDEKMVDTLINTVGSKFGTSQKFYALKAKLFGFDKLAYHERSLTYGNFDAQYSYQQSVELVYEVFLNLDPEFAKIFRGFVENGTFDVYPRKGKSGGAFCTEPLLSQPTYILLNHTNKLRDVSTIAHESGHGIHSQLMRGKQISFYFNFSMATAEVASTFMEDFVLEKLRHGLSDEQRLSLMMQKIGDEVATIFRQIACYKFEQELHREYREKGYLPQEAIGALFRKHMQAYMGDAISYDPGSENWWVYWHHIRSYFYVYSYASGLLISKFLQNKVRHDKSFVQNVKEFLSAGSSDSPAGLFKKMGIDVYDRNFWLQGLSETENLLNEAEQLAKKLGKI